MTLPSSGPLSINDIAGEFGGSTPHAMSEYYAGGGLVPAGTSGTYGAVPSSGTISIQNFYGTSNYVPVYIEDIFSTWLYTGNGATQTITNGINLSTNGGLVWTKLRTTTSGFNFRHALVDTARGVNYQLWSDDTQGSTLYPNTLTAFNSNGYTLGADTNTGLVNNSSYGTNTYVSWTFRKQPKFFDIVTYTGDGTDNRQISHSLGSIPGCFIIKALNLDSGTVAGWFVYHRSLTSPNANPQDNCLFLNTTDQSQSTSWLGAAPTSTTITLKPTGGSFTNTVGVNYVVYLFAHNAGGFGLTGTDNVISCGSFTTDGSGNATVNLGYEPQWVLWKSSSNSSSWNIADNMRGFTASGPGGRILNPNNTNAEGSSSGQGINSTGFSLIGSNANRTFIYVAIRRGPMKTPTTGTSVFSPTNSNSGGFITTNFVVDSLWQGWKSGSTNNATVADRLRRVSTDSDILYGPYLRTSNTGTEDTASSATQGWNNIGFTNADAGNNTCQWAFRRAPGFFDVICYTGDGTNARAIAHNLGVAPALVITKTRTGLVDAWRATYAFGTGTAKTVYLNYDFAADTGTIAAPTASNFFVYNTTGSNYSSSTFVAYLFATLAGVSRVGTYTGTGALQTVNCGFTGGARFVLIKRTDSTGDWFVYDSARGISSGNDPYLFLNSTAAEVTGTNYVDTTSVGFQVTAAAPAGINANGGNYLFLAIA